MAFQTRERPTTFISYAVLEYIGHTDPIKANPNDTLFGAPSTHLGWLDYTLEPLTNNYMPPSSSVTRRITLSITQLTLPSSIPSIFWTVASNLTWTESTTQKPYLVAVYDNKQKYLPKYTLALQNSGIDPTVRAFPACLGEILDIVIQTHGLGPNGQPDVHPFHMHGPHFYNLGSGNGSYDAEANERRLEGTRPVLRDTTMLFRPWADAPKGVANGWKAWRVNVTVPGVWMLHCHTLAHMVMGMQSVWVFGDGEEVAQVGEPYVKGYMEYGGSAYGNASFYSLVMHWFGCEGVGVVELGCMMYFVICGSMVVLYLRLSCF